MSKFAWTVPYLIGGLLGWLLKYFIPIIPIPTIALITAGAAIGQLVWAYFVLVKEQWIIGVVGICIGVAGYWFLLIKWPIPTIAITILIGWIAGYFLRQKK